VKPRRVLIIVQNLPVPLDRRVWLEATTLARAGYRVTVICPKGRGGQYGASHETIEDIEVFRYPAPPEADGVAGYMVEFAYCWLMTAMLSVRAALARGFDVMHACNPPETYFALALMYRPLGKKFLFDHHDLSPEMYLAKGGKRDGLLHRTLLLLERLTFRAADIVIATNESHKEIAIQRGGVDPERVYVVRSGPDLDRLRPVAPEPMLRDGCRYLVCYLGEMCPQDGVDLLLEAARTLVVEMGRRDTKFVIIGGGPALETLRRLKSSLGLDDRVVFTGRISDQDLCRYLSVADVCVDPDPYTEWSNQSTMNKIVEYMAFGRPIVAFNLKENRFSAAEAAVYATPNDVREFASLIAMLLDDESTRGEMGRIGRQRVEDELSWEHSRPRLLAAYARITGPE
jgi:glycosyltransferase involved in cell wall biosynthesis